MPIGERCWSGSLPTWARASLPLGHVSVAGLGRRRIRRRRRSTPRLPGTDGGWSAGGSPHIDPPMDRSRKSICPDPVIAPSTIPPFKVLFLSPFSPRCPFDSSVMNTGSLATVGISQCLVLIRWHYVGRWLCNLLLNQSAALGLIWEILASEASLELIAWFAKRKANVIKVPFFYVGTKVSAVHFVIMKAAYSWALLKGWLQRGIFWFSGRCLFIGSLCRKSFFGDLLNDL